MHRMFVTMLLSTALSCFSYGQNLKTNFAAKETPIADAPFSRKAPADGVSRKGSDTLAMRTNTTAPPNLIVGLSAAAQKDSGSREAETRELSSPELKNLTETASNLDPNGYTDTHWGMTLREARKYILDNDSVDEKDIQEVTNGFEYTGSLSGVDAVFAYQFDNDRLFIVQLTPNVKAISKFDFLDSFDNYRTILEAKYGKPVRSGFSKVDESYLSTY